LAKRKVKTPLFVAAKRTRDRPTAGSVAKKRRFSAIGRKKKIGKEIRRGKKRQKRVASEERATLGDAG